LGEAVLARPGLAGIDDTPVMMHLRWTGFHPLEPLVSIKRKAHNDVGIYIEVTKDQEPLKRLVD
jgi:hypothetical protein